MYIPKKVHEKFTKAIPKFQKILKSARNRDLNESDTIDILTDILGDVFGYNKYVEVTSEFAIRGTYCDLAIIINDKAQFLIEVKAIGIELKDTHLRQAVNYGANHGIPWIILTNGIEWQIYRILFEKPIKHELVTSFAFNKLNPKDKKVQQKLFLIHKKGLAKNAREEFYEKIQCVNRFTIAAMISSEPILKVLRRELRKYSEGVKVNLPEIRNIVNNQVLKRELIEDEKAKKTLSKVKRFYKKQKNKNKRKKKAKKQNKSPVNIKSADFYKPNHSATTPLTKLPENNSNE